MTPTASSSSILLLTPAAPAANSALTTDMQAAPDAGLSGFELLLGAMQQLQQELTSGVEVSAAGAEGDAESSGNPLPLPGMLLPLSGLPGKAAGLDNQLVGAEDKKSCDSDSSADVDAAFLLFNAAQSAPLPLTNKASLGEGLNSAQSAGVEIAPLTTADALASQMSATTAVNGAPVKDSGNGKSDRGSVLSPTLGVTELGRAPSESANLAVLDDSAPADVDMPLPNTSAPASVAESDFDVLVKQFETVSSPQPGTAPAAIGEATPVHQAARTYTNAMSNGAAIPVPVGGDGWGDAVVDKVMWFSANKISSAEIHLNPPDLGPLQVRVSTQQDQASVVFTSQHAAVRDALDQALPRLRDMMGNQGMQLLDVSVGGQTPQQQQQFARNDAQQSGAQFGGLNGGDETQAANVTSIETARLVRSGFDAYA